MSPFGDATPMPAADVPADDAPADDAPRPRPWGGRFEAGVADEMQAFSSSLAEDARLVRHDVLGSLAHVRALHDADLLTDAEAAELAAGLRAVLADLRSGEATLDPALEDVHMNVEALLRDRVGELAGKLHAGRSRNDQVVLDLRLWTRQALLDLGAGLWELADALLAQAGDHADTPMAGTTHLQPAQPVTLGHVLHAHARRALRDADRALDAYRRTNAASPLGAGALASTTLPLDPAVAAAALGFDAAFDNSLDAVADRGFAADALFAAAQAAVDLSGLAEELVLWSSPQFGYVALPESYATGSSLMPQKRNPDAAELVRGRAGEAVGDLAALMTTLKGLPSGYHRDLQEAKRPLLRTLPRVAESARVLAAAVQGATVHQDRLADGVTDALFATDLAEWRVEQGVPFRRAHEEVGALVREAEAAGVGLAEMAEKRWPGAGEVFDVGRALDRRVHGPAPARVAERVRAAREDAEALRSTLVRALGRLDAAEANLLGGDGPS